MRILRFCVACTVMWLGGLWSPRVSAQQLAGGDNYALLVGSNEGGPGQATLRYAEADTERVAEVLTALGGYPKTHVERLLHPTAAQLRDALARMRERVAQPTRSGAPSRFFFYYSGHARSDALNLAGESVPLPELREHLEALPATLSIVVLDACQSGAFSRPKGAAPAADFSFNSVDRLNTAGMAVIASSNEGELSQESDLLHSSYFTHHWLVGLRGAGDHNRDGRVSLSEAYQYAYNHTLATTAETAVGEQHATLETNLRGQDEVSLTQPSAASARLRVPASFDGRILLQALPSWSVLAELDKVPGDPVTLALPAGDYAATLRRGDSAARCSLRLRDGGELLLDANQCELLEQHTGEVKGERLSRAERRAQRQEERRARYEAELIADRGKRERFVFEAGFGLGLSDEGTKFIKRLNDFSYEDRDDWQPRVAVSAGYRLNPHLVLGIAYYNLEARTYTRWRDLEQSFRWTGHALNAYAQADVAFGRRRLLNLFAKVGVGASLAWTGLDAVRPEPDFPDASDSLETTSARLERVNQHFVRPNGFIGGGIQVMPSRYIGFLFEARYVFAPAIENAFGETHNLGGGVFFFGLRGRTWE